MSENKLTRRELATLFHVGRKLELVACYVPMSEPQGRTVKAQRSYGYDMEKPDGKVSRLDSFSGMTIIGVSPAGNGYTEIKLLDADGQLAAHYRLV